MSWFPGVDLERLARALACLTDRDAEAIGSVLEPGCRVCLEHSWVYAKGSRDDPRYFSSWSVPARRQPQVYAEALISRGLLPEDLEDGGRRGFRLPPGPRLAEEGDAWDEHEPQPGEVATLLALAACWPAVLTAEAIAAEAWRLWPDGGRGRPAGGLARITWSRDTGFEAARLGAVEGLGDALVGLSLRAGALRLSTEGPWEGPSAPLLSRYGLGTLHPRDASDDWGRALKAGLVTGPDPYAGLVALLATGCGVRRLTPERAWLTLPSLVWPDEPGWP